MIIYFYKITNLINGRFYYGVHSTKNIDDEYMGSGIAIRRAIKKYGISNFKKDILKIFDSIEKAYEYEKNIVDENLVKNENSYNLTVGGKGGFYHIDSKGPNNPMFGKSDLQKEIQARPEVKQKKSITMKRVFKEKYDNGYVNPSKPYLYWKDSEKAEKAKKLMSENHADVFVENNPFYGKKHSNNSLEKMSNSHKNRERVICPHCSKILDVSNARRWHFDNCKNKEK